MRKIASILVKYFFQGIIIISPIAITFYAAYAIFDFIDIKIPNLPRGVGFLIVVFSMISIGWLGSTFLFSRIVIDFFDSVLERTPFIKFIYSSVKEVVESFMGDKRKFTKPVLVKVRNNPEIFQVGFITQKDLSALGLHNKVAVYMPHAYAVSGYMYIVDKDNISPLDMNPSDAMKMAVSGGVAGFNEEEAEEKKLVATHQKASQLT
ncbi:MAG: DUF502 domain-containing protein [Chitinophagaceae bacterium]